MKEKYKIHLGLDFVFLETACWAVEGGQYGWVKTCLPVHLWCLEAASRCITSMAAYSFFHMPACRHKVTVPHLLLKPF